MWLTKMHMVDFSFLSRNNHLHYFLYVALWPLHLGQSVGRRGNPPQPARVQMALDKEKWHTNKPTVNAILQAWVAPQPSIQDNQSLMSSIAEQKWKGLALQDFGERKGKGKMHTTFRQIASERF